MEDRAIPEDSHKRGKPQYQRSRARRAPATTAVDVNTYDENGETPIHLAVVANDAELVRLVLAKGADPSQGIQAELCPPDNAMEYAARLNRTSALKALLDSGIPVSSGALEAAASQGNLEAATILLDHAVGEPQRHEAVAKALETAAKLWSPEMVQLLLDSCPQLPQQALDSALLATCTNHQFIVDLYQPKPAWSWERASTVTKLLIQAGANANKFHETASPPSALLHRAVRQPNVPGAFIRLLIESGANVEAKDCEGSTPLICALNYHYQSDEAVHQLVSAGANLEVIDAVDGNTLLHLAYNAGIAELFLGKGKGADVATRNNDGQTPLDLASQLGRKDVVRVLMDYGKKTRNQGQELNIITDMTKNATNTIRI